MAAFAPIGAFGSAAHSAEVTCAWSHSVGYLPALCDAWIVVEEIGEWMRARKRIALGLGDPAVADRFLVGGLSGTAALAPFSSKAYTEWLRARSAAG